MIDARNALICLRFFDRIVILMRCVVMYSRAREGVSSKLSSCANRQSIPLVWTNMFGDVGLYIIVQWYCSEMLNDVFIMLTFIHA